jgi:peptide/nickel transport system substrate-binding protein
VFVVDQWRKIGLNVTHTPQEGGLTSRFPAGNFDAGIDFTCEFMDEPDLYLLKYLSSDKSPINYSRYKDATLDELYERQSRMLDLKDRLPLLRQIEKRAIAEQAYQFPVLWWQRIVPHHERLKGWKIGPSHYVNQDLRDVWLGP